ncbi:MAG: macro domain-containing protein [Acidimicrobiales bacterium]|nr:macro domain-containing protein [Acidimicrobiales bacterium]
MVIETWRGDITTLEVDAIVNAANSSLRRGAGVCGAIFAGAGPELDEACAAIGYCAPGDAVVTPGFGLPSRWIVHTVGPVWQGGNAGEDTLLESCYRRSMEAAVAVGARSIAFPAISTGVFGFPPERAACIAVATVKSTSIPELDRVILVAFDDPTYGYYRRLLAG